MCGLGRNDHLVEDNFNVLEFLKNPISDFSLKIDCGFDPLYNTPPLLNDYEDELLVSYEDLSNNPFDFGGGICLVECSSIKIESFDCLLKYFFFYYV